MRESHASSWGKALQEEGIVRAKTLVCSKNSKEADLTGLQLEKGSIVGKEVREVARAHIIWGLDA